MNILYLSHLTGSEYAGPTYSVPKQIEAQSKIDRVFWYNAVSENIGKWRELVYYHDLKDFPRESIKDLPTPFNKPDLIVVELFYNMTGTKLQKELMTSEIPYVIVPRGELTKNAQLRKSLKKTLANIWICKRYARKAIAIQYLTDQECKDSGDCWNRNHVIIPNGIDIPSKTKEFFNSPEIRCVFIGRIEPYQKGLDLLIEACKMIRAKLIEKKCKIVICGPDKEGKLSELKKMTQDNDLSSFITFCDGVYGKEKEKLLLGNDIFLVPSRFEGHPMALVEALAYGLPIVATVGSNMKAEIERYGAGWTADNTAKSISKALQKMIDDRESFKLKSVQAKRLSKQYEWNSIAQKSHMLYERLLDMNKTKEG